MKRLTNWCGWMVAVLAVALVLPGCQCKCVVLVDTQASADARTHGGVTDIRVDTRDESHGVIDAR